MLSSSLPCQCKRSPNNTQMSEYGCVSVTVYLQEKSKISPNAWPYFQRQCSKFNWKIIWLNLFWVTHVNLAHSPVGPAGRQTFPTTSEKQSLLIWFPQGCEFKKTDWYLLSWNCVLIKGDSCSPETPFCELYLHEFPGPVYLPPSDLTQLKECSRWPGRQDQISIRQSGA